MTNNETISQSAEVAVCELFHIPHSIGMDRIDRPITNNIKTKLARFLSNHPNITITEWTASCGNKIDFKLSNGKTLSLKTLKRNYGKICPQVVGQPTLKKWDQIFNTNITQNYTNHNKIESIRRWKLIKKDLISFLNKYLENTFCCDYLLLISNCNQNPVCSLLSKPCKFYNFEKECIRYDRPMYEERWNSTKQKYSEFSTKIYLEKDNNEKINIGEFQFHKNSRRQIKFRFFNTFFNDHQFE